jgi:hypothetical protein
MPDTPQKTSPASQPDKPLAPDQEARLDALIGAKLRQYYEELIAEPVPDRILDLLAALEEKERKSRQGEA